MNILIDLLNRSAESFAGFALAMFLQSSILILAFLGLDTLLRHRVRAVVRYAVGLLLLVKLVLPPSLALPTGIGYWLAISQKPPATASVAIPRAVAFKNEPLDGASMYSLLTDASIKSPPPPSLHGKAWLLLACFAGGLGLLAVLVRRSAAVKKKIATASPASPALVSLLEQCSARLGLRRTPRLKLVDCAMSPAVCGLWWPVILLPQRLVEKLSEPQLRAVLLHELAHVKRADVWVNYAQTLLQIFYWWHPLLWLANARIRRVREEAVDETVMVELGREAEAYPLTLIEVAKLTLSRAVLSLGLVGILESKSALKRRVHRLVNYPVPRSARLSFASVLVCTVLGALLLPMARGQRAAAASPPKPVSEVKSGDAEKFIGATGNFVLLPREKLEAMMLPRTAPTYSALGVKGWPVSKNFYDTMLIRAEGLGGFRSGAGPALLPGFEGIAHSGQSLSLGITTQLISRSPDGKRTGEARYIPANIIDDTPTGGSRIALVATLSEKKTQLTFQARCQTDYSQEVARGTERSSVETNFVFSATLDQPTDSHGVLLLCEDPEIDDGRVLLVLLTTRVMNADQVNGVGVIRVLGNGQYALNGQAMTLDELHSRLFEEKQKFFHYGIQIEKEPEVKDDDLEKIKERLHWLGIDEVKIGDPVTFKSGLSYEKTGSGEAFIGKFFATNSRERSGGISTNSLLVVGGDVGFGPGSNPVAESQTAKEDSTPQLFTRTFDADKADFLRGIAAKLGKPAPTNSVEEIQNFVKEYFAGQGIKTMASPTTSQADPGTFFYNDRAGVLLARFPTAELNKIEQAIDEAAQQGHAYFLRAQGLSDKLEDWYSKLAMSAQALDQQNPALLAEGRFSSESSYVEALEKDLKMIDLNAAANASLHVIVLNKSDDVFLNTHRVALKNLNAELQPFIRENPNRAAIIHADQESSAQKLLKLMEALREANVRSISVRRADEPAHGIVNIHAKFLSAPTAAITKLALGQPVSTDVNGVATWLLSPKQMSSLWNLPTQTAGFETLASPSITTEDGREAAMFVGAIPERAPSTPKVSESSPNANGTVFSVNAIGYVNALKSEDKEIEDAVLIGPSLRVLPKIVGQEVELSIDAKVTKLAGADDVRRAAKLGAGPLLQTNFQATASGRIAEGGGLLIVGKPLTANKGTNYAVIVSATVGGK